MCILIGVHFFIRKSLLNGICQHNLTKAGNKARKGDWHQGSSRWAAHPQRDAGDVGAKGADRGNRHRCRLTYTGRVTYYRTAAPSSKQTDKRTWKEKPRAWRTEWISGGSICFFRREPSEVRKEERLKFISKTLIFIYCVTHTLLFVLRMALMLKLSASC